MKTIVIPGTVTDRREGIFDDSPSITIYCPKGSVADSYAEEFDLSAATTTSPITDLTFSAGSLQLMKGESKCTKLAITPESFDDTLTFSSNDTSIATVDYF